jgi:hypothetical protein
MACFAPPHDGCSGQSDRRAGTNVCSPSNEANRPAHKARRLEERLVARLCPEEQAPAWSERKRAMHQLSAYPAPPIVGIDHHFRHGY